MKILFSAFLLLLGVTASAADPTATHYTMAECQGSAMPYPVPATNLRTYPDSLKPVFISHIGRHGARFLSSSKYTTALARELADHPSLTPRGKAAVELCRRVEGVTAGRWGALDSLGMAEQRGIAARTWQAFPMLFSYRTVGAIASYVPRCIASMDEFTHQLSRMDNKIEIYTSSGRQNNDLLRPWAKDADYKEYKDGEAWRKVYDGYADSQIPLSVADRYFTDATSMDEGRRRDFALNLYKVVSSCASFGISINAGDWFTPEEYNALWSVGNLEHYLTHSASTLSSAPMDLAAALLNDMVEDLDKAAEGMQTYGAQLRFGHAETMMPLLALIRLGGCYYITNYFDTVGLHWRDFYVVPMASNLQLVLFRADSGRYYLRADFNETPVPLMPGSTDLYLPWSRAREYLIRCLPLYLQP